VDERSAEVRRVYERAGDAVAVLGLSNTIGIAILSGLRNPVEQASRHPQCEYGSAELGDDERRRIGRANSGKSIR
jgi:hypothetical protein